MQIQKKKFETVISHKRIYDEQYIKEKKKKGCWIKLSNKIFLERENVQIKDKPQILRKFILKMPTGRLTRKCIKMLPHKELGMRFCLTLHLLSCECNAMQHWQCNEGNIRSNSNSEENMTSLDGKQNAIGQSL